MTLIKRIFSFATVTLLIALSLGSIAAWYSIQGLVAIFSAAALPIMIMGGSLEFAKVVTTVWLHRYWHRAKWQMKLYLVPSVVALAFLTSMGIYGYLAKAHSDQSLVSGDVQAKIEIYEQKLQTSKDTIDADRKALKQLDEAVDQTLGRTTDAKGAARAVSLRRSQSDERNRLANEIETEQANSAKLNEQMAPIKGAARKVEAEVGPIKYIAALIYGDNPSNDLLERAVRWVIILIVFVFDPLALMLVLAAQSSYEWLEEDNKQQDSPKVLEEAPEDESESIQPDDVDVDVELGDDLPKEHIPDAIGHVEELEPVEDEPSGAAEPITEPDTIEDAEPRISPVLESDIKTENVTLEKSEDGYLIYAGKSISSHALKELRTDLFAAKPDAEQVNTNFGTSFPNFAKKGDIFVRVDSLPNRVFKFDSLKWIEINKEQTDSYLYDKEYLNYLVTKIERGEYDVELLSENEKAELEQYLQSKKS